MQLREVALYPWMFFNFNFRMAVENNPTQKKNSTRYEFLSDFIAQNPLSQSTMRRQHPF